MHQYNLLDELGDLNRLMMDGTGGGTINQPRADDICLCDSGIMRGEYSKDLFRE